MATQLQSWPPPEPPKPPLAISHTARALLSGTQQAIAFVRFIALQAEHAVATDDYGYTCIYCAGDGEHFEENIKHDDDCLYLQACLIAEKLRLEGVPW